MSHKLIKFLVMLLSATLIVATLGANAGDAFAAPARDAPSHTPKNHTFHSVQYEKVYANPDSRKEDGAFLVGLILLHPALQGMKRVSQALTWLGITTGALALLNREKTARDAQGYYILEKRVYKAKKPSSGYWGYQQTFIYSSVTKKKIKGKTMTVGKTSY